MSDPYKAHDVLWISFDPMFGEVAVLNEVATEYPGRWALRYRLDATQEPGVNVTSDRDRAVAVAERERIIAILCEKQSRMGYPDGNDLEHSYRRLFADGFRAATNVIRDEGEGT